MQDTELFMIETKAIDPSGIAIDCPHCRKALLTVFPHGPKKAFDRYLYTDGDTVPIESAPRHRLLGWDIELRLGTCPFCAGVYFGLTARFIDAIPDDDVIRVYFFRNGDRGEENNFIGRHSEETWIVSRFDTPPWPDARTSIWAIRRNLWRSTRAESRCGLRHRRPVGSRETLFADPVG